MLTGLQKRGIDEVKKQDSRAPTPTGSAAGSTAKRATKKKKT